MKKILLSPWLALVTLIVLLSIRIADTSFTESVRLRYFDQLITNSEPTKVNVHTVNIDEDTLDRYGQFPFSRDIYASIINDLYSRGAGMVIFNVLMPEEDRFKKDGVLANTMKNNQVILAQLGSTKLKGEPSKSVVQVFGVSDALPIVRYPGLISNVAEVQQHAAGIGMVNTLPEIDGVVRRMPLLLAVEDTVYPALPLEIIRVVQGDTRIQAKLNENGVEAIRIPKFGRIEPDNLSRIWLDWTIQPTSHSLTKLPKSFYGHTVIVGVTASGITQPVATSKGEVWPHEIQAIALGTLTNNKPILRPTWAGGAELAIILACGLLVIFFGVFRRK